MWHVGVAAQLGPAWVKGDRLHTSLPVASEHSSSSHVYALLGLSGILIVLLGTTLRVAVGPGELGWASNNLSQDLLSTSFPSRERSST